jgi:hypothetical protein
VPVAMAGNLGMIRPVFYHCTTITIQVQIDYVIRHIYPNNDHVEFARSSVNTKPWVMPQFYFSLTFMQGSLTEGEGSVWLTSLYQLVQINSFFIEMLFTFFTKQATLIRRSTVLSFPQLVFPDL